MQAARLAITQTNPDATGFPWSFTLLAVDQQRNDPRQARGIL
jgi:hypothetical protein